MWFGFGIITFIVAIVVGTATRLSARWRGEVFFDAQGEYQVQQTWNKGQLVRVRIGVNAPEGFTFRVRQERWPDRASKWIGLAYELQTKDPEFDRSLYIEADARGIAMLLKRHAPLRHALMEIFALGGETRCKNLRVRCAQRRLWIEFTPKNKKDAPEAIKALVPPLHRLRTALLGHPLTPQDLEDPFLWRAAVVLSFSTAALFLGLFGLIRATAGRTDILDPWGLLYACLAPGLLLALCLLIGVIKWLGGTSRAHLVVLEFALTGTIGLVLSAFALAREANIEFDDQTSYAVVITNVCAEHRITRGRGTRHNYYLHAWDWRAGREGSRKLIEISRDDYYRLRDVTSVKIDVKPGALGFAWVEYIHAYAEPMAH